MFYHFLSCSTVLSIDFTLLENVKMPTLVDILIFISKINTTESFKAKKKKKKKKKTINFQFSLYEHLKFHARVI